MPGPVFLDGEVVTLRAIEEEDLPFLQRAVNDPEVWRAIGAPEPVNSQQEQEFFDDVVCSDDSIDLLIAADDDPVGIVSFWPGDGTVSKAELGYWVAPDHHRQGYASEATELMIDYGFAQLGYHRIEARVFEYNDASQNLLEGLGFVREGAHREAVFVDGEYQDLLWFGLLEDEWTGAE
jgi:RimJ/RimL family protein N-acetyltransferase